MKTLFVFLFVLLAFYSCDMDDPINAEDSLVTTDKETDAIELTAQPGSYLIWLKGASAETKKIAGQLQAVNHYDKALSFNDLPGVISRQHWSAMARDTLNDLTIVGNVADFYRGYIYS